jgi:hypothetical protein
MRQWLSRMSAIRSIAGPAKLLTPPPCINYSRQSLGFMSCRKSLAELRSARWFAGRRAAFQPPAPRYERGYRWIFSRRIKQADQSCDLDFLETAFGRPTPDPAIN